MKLIAVSKNNVNLIDAATMQVDLTITLADASITIDSTISTDPTAADLRAGLSADTLTFWNANIPTQADGVILIGF